MFRKEALQSLSSPEKLDEPIRYLRPQHWFLLLTLLGAGGYFIGWSFFGRIPIRIEGHGVLVAANSLYRIQSQATGPIRKLLVKQGDCVKAGQIVAEVEPGTVYKGKVVRIVDFGAFVQVLPGKEGLLHISQIAHERVEKVSDYLSEGEEIEVKALEVDNRGRIKLSRKELLPKPEREAPAEPEANQEAETE